MVWHVWLVILGINEIIVDGKSGLLIKPTEEGLAEGLKRLIEIQGYGRD